MTRRTYASVLDAVLKPEGFIRQGQDFTRVRDGFRDEVNVQTSTIAGVTANLYTIDVETERLCHEAVGDDSVPGVAYVRIGTLIDGFDRWWLKDPNGPAELSQAVRKYGLPYFEKQRSPEVQSRWLAGHSERWVSAPSRICYAITLYRMGKPEETCEALANPPKRTLPSWLERIEAARRWLGCDGCGTGATPGVTNTAP